MDVESAVIDSLGYRRANEIERLLIQSDRNIESAIDINDFPYIVNKNWDSAFDTLLNDDRAFRNQLWLIVECRNAEWAHPSDGDAECESTRAHLFLIADVLGKIKNTEAKDRVEAIRDELFSPEAEERLVALETENSEYKKSLAAAQAEGNDHKERFETTEKELNTAKNQLKKVKAENTKYKKSLAAAEKGLETAQTERNEYKERFETTEQELENAKAEWQTCEDNLKATSDRLEDAVGAWMTSMESLTALRKLFMIAKIGNQTVQEVFQSVYPSIETDSTVRILDRRGIDKQNYLLALLEQKQPTLIYVQSEEMVDLLLERVVPEKADLIEKHGEQTSEAEEREILERLENGEKIAVVSDTTLSTLASAHCIEHFVFCHLVPSLDKFFNQCEPAFASEKSNYLHLIYESKQNVEELAEKYPKKETLRKLYQKFRDCTPTEEFINLENLYSKFCKESELNMTKLGIETGFSIFEELGFSEQNEEGIRRISVPSTKTELEASKIYCRGEKLKKEIVNFPAFQYEQSIEQIWKEILEKLNRDGEQILREVSPDEMYSGVSEMENDLQPTEIVEDDNQADEEDTEASQTSEPARANAAERRASIADRYVTETTEEDRNLLAVQIAEMRINATGSRPIAWKNIRDKFGLKEDEFHKVIRPSLGYLEAVINRIKTLKSRDEGWEYNGKLGSLTGIDNIENFLK